MPAVREAGLRSQEQGDHLPGTGRASRPLKGVVYPKLLGSHFDPYGAMWNCQAGSFRSGTVYT